jgi:hypothetical protein
MITAKGSANPVKIPRSIIFKAYIAKMRSKATIKFESPKLSGSRHHFEVKV